VATFFAVAMATTLLAAFFQSQIRRPQTAEARAIEAAAPMATPANGTPLTLDTFRNIVKAKNAGVVNITVSSKPKATRGGRQLPFPFFQDDDPLGPNQPNQRSGGSGFIIDADGTILTNRHVVDEADQINVTLESGKRYDAKVVGKDARTDVAVIKIEPKEPLTVLELGDSEAAEVGDWVMAIGSPFGLGNSLSVGVVSGKGSGSRNISLGQPNTGIDMLQTDAAINPGNSGGPLLNTQGRVIGINTLIITQGLAQNAGVGFSVPINTVKAILPQLKTRGKVIRGWLGVSIQSASEDVALTFGRSSAQGVVVADVTKDSPAEKAGIALEDYIYEVDGRAVTTNSSLTNYIASLPPGTTVTLKLIRAGAEKSVRITLGTFPEGDIQTAANDDGDDAESEEKAASNLGVELQTLSPALRERMDLPNGLRGVVVRSVEAGGAGELAGLARGDVILMVSGEEVSSVKEFNAAVRKAASTRAARLRVRRGDNVIVMGLRLDR
jgi:serine protease Do